MELRNYVCLILLLCSSFMGYASGNDIIPFFGLEILLLIAFIILLLNLKIKMKGKLLLTLVFILSNVIVFVLTSDIPYSQNLIWINSISIVFPISSILISYIIIQSRFKK
jgi:hypothetical protein